MKIYIIGPPGSGKTTLARMLAQKYNTTAYELDCLVYDDNNNHIKRTDEVIMQLFDEILNKDSWIIEDVGRKKFNKGLIYCNKIYYLKINKFRVYIRVIKRWFRQRLGKEKYNYPPTLLAAFDMLRITKKYFKNEREKLKILEKYPEKLIYLKNKDLQVLHKTK